MAAAASFFSSNRMDSLSTQSELECAVQKTERKVSSYLQGCEGKFRIQIDAWDDGYYAGTVLNRLISLVPIRWFYTGWFYTGFVKEISLRSFEDGRIFLCWAPDYGSKKEVALFKKIQKEFGFPCDEISFMETGPLALEGLDFLNIHNELPPGQYQRFKAILSGKAALKPLPLSPFDRGVVDRSSFLYQEALKNWASAQKVPGNFSSERAT